MAEPKSVPAFLLASAGAAFLCVAASIAGLQFIIFKQELAILIPLNGIAAALFFIASALFRANHDASRKV